MKLSSLSKLLEQLVPSCFAEVWDNVGLISGDPQQKVTRILLAVDLTPGVLAEAKKRRAQMVLLHHPPILQKTNKLINNLDSTGLIYEAIHNGIAVYVMHTNLDAIEGGTNSVLAEMLGISINLRPVRLVRTGSNYKLVMFVPAEQAEMVGNAVFAAGAGRIGHQHRYSECSFCCGGVGSFHGDNSTSPAVGRSGRREYVQELRLETIVPAAEVPAVLTAMRTAHPYEEPAYDLIPLEPLDDRVGQGRIGKLTRPVTVETLLRRIKKALGIKSLKLIGPSKRTVGVVATGAGSISDMLPDVLKTKAEFLLTGEIKHNWALLAAQNGLSVAVAGHWTTERPGMERLAKHINSAVKGVAVVLSSADSEPLVNC
ncbi:MAG: Nif3-like dinuclear metal center hexameric protein [Actinobacteria bacterium]|nr:Nif3-like dinuclear metal center hexameric protein [Actinomycetota bacterium]